MSKKEIKPKLKTQKQKQTVIQNSLFTSYRKYIEFFVILILVFITYGNSIKNDYNIDDGFIVSLDNANVLTKKGIKGIPEIFTSKYNEGEGVTYGYRPLAKVTMAIEYSLWENNPQYSHFVNLLLYALNVFLLLLFFKRIALLFNYTNHRLIYLAILLFIIHPIHTEVVCSIKNREEILCFSLLISAVLVYLRFSEERKWSYVFPFLLFTFLALLAKETAFNIFGILLLISFFKAFVLLNEKIRFKEFLKKIVTTRNVIIVVTIFISYFLFNSMNSALPEGDIGFHFEQNPYRFFPESHSIPNGLHTILFYIKKLLVPFPLLFYYGYDMLPLQSWNSLNTILAIVAMIIIICVIIYNIKKRKELFLIFWILYFFSCMFPFSNMLYPFYVTGIIGERLIYQASAGFCIFFAWLVFLAADVIINSIEFKNNYKGRMPYYIASLIVLPFLVLTINRNFQWKDKNTLYKHDIKYLTKSARSNFIISNNYMKELSKESIYADERLVKLNTAKNYLHQALIIYPDFDDALINLGIIHHKYLSNSDSAVICFKKVNNSNAFSYSRAQELLGDIYYTNYKNSKEAVIYYRKGFDYTPKNKPLYKKIMQVYFEQAIYDTIISVAQKAIANDWIEGYIDRGDAYLNKKDTALAILDYDQAILKGYNKPFLFNIQKYKQSH